MQCESECEVRSLPGISFGPFTVLCNTTDLQRVINYSVLSILSMYADDSILYTIWYLEDCVLLQKDIDSEKTAAAIKFRQNWTNNYWNW